jgi:hypothetical protein
MRVIALLCLVFGFVMQGLLDGQTFTHAVLGVVFGAVAIACGLASARKDPPHRWERIMAFLGLGLGVWCIIMLPSAYRFQEHFNSRREQRQQKEEQNKPANKPAAGNAGWAPQLAIGHHWPGVPEPGR